MGAQIGDGGSRGRRQSSLAEINVTPLVDVMLARQKSGLAFQAVTEVRNKLVSAYQDIMSMQV